MRLAALALAAALAGCAPLPKIFSVSDPLTADEHARLGAAYEAQGALAEADAQYERAVALDRRHHGAWMALGNRAYAAGEFAKAARRYRIVLRLVPRHPGASNNLAMVYLAQNRRLDEAEALAHDALVQGGPLRPHILDTLARIERVRGRKLE